MPIYKKCMVEEGEGEVCGKVVPSQGLHGHLVGHGLEGEELKKAMEEAKTVDDPNKTKEEKKAKEEAPAHGQLDSGEEGLEKVPPLPEEQMVKEMASQLERELQYLPRFEKGAINYILERFKKEPVLQEDPNQLFRAMQIASPQCRAEFISTSITNIFAVKQKYNIEMVRALRGYPTFPTAQGAMSSQINPNPFPDQNIGMAASGFIQPYPWGGQQPPQTGVQPPHMDVQGQEIKNLVDEVKDLKSEINKKEEDGKFQQMLNQQKEESKAIVDELKTDREKSEARHKEEMVELKKQIEGGKERDKYRELESQVGAINSKLDQTTLGLKDMFTEYLFKDKEKTHERDLKDLERKIEESSKEKTSEMDMFDKLDKWEERMDTFAKRRGYAHSKADIKEQLITQVTETVDKASDFFFKEKDGESYQPPPVKDFTPLAKSERDKLTTAAAQKAQKDLEERQRELKKVQAENERLKALEAEMAKKEAEKKVEPPPKTPPKTPEKKEKEAKTK